MFIKLLNFLHIMIMLGSVRNVSEDNVITKLYPSMHK